MGSTIPFQPERILNIQSNNSKGIVIWGTGGCALLAVDILDSGDNPVEYQLHGFVDDTDSAKHGQQLCGVPVLGGREVLDGLMASNINHILPAFGNCPARLQLCLELESLGFQVPGLVHASAVVSRRVEIDTGSVVGPAAIINSATRIGKAVLVNSGALVEHDSVIGNGTHICPGVAMGGHVSIGDASWIGIGATVKNGVTIGNRVVVGAGAVVVDDLPDDVVAWGVPARVHRKQSDAKNEN